MENKTFPSVGIIDSGLGGLTIYRALKQLTPNQHVVYFADTKYLPYGSKSTQELQKRATQIAHFFQKQNINLLIIACHTLATCANLTFENSLSCPVISIHSASLNLLGQHKELKHLALLATKSTIDSSYYQSHLSSCFPNIKITSIACPSFVKLVEKGWHKTYLAQATAKYYLRSFVNNKPDALFLGCTHFPFFIPTLTKALADPCPFIDPTDHTAELAYQHLPRHAQLFAPDLFFISKNPLHFERQTEKLLKNFNSPRPLFFFSNC